MKTKQKKLQTSSKYNEYDLDGDGVVSDAELANMKEIKETETALRKNLAQLRMARYTLIAMGFFTFLHFRRRHRGCIYGHHSLDE
jgi:Ca2+-binding EF-hand superfamily protein